jgi:sulfur carrier protein ThiS
VAAARAARDRSSPAAPRREGRHRIPRLVKVILRNPRREVDVEGKRRVKELLTELGILPSTVLVIRDNELLTSDAVVGDDDVLEVRPVMSGGAGAAA